MHNSDDGRTRVRYDDPKRLRRDACRELEVLQAPPSRQVPQRGNKPLLGRDGLAHHSVLPRDIGGQKIQQTVEYGVRHTEKVPKVIRIILPDFPKQRHMRELVTLAQPILGPGTPPPPVPDQATGMMSISRSNP